MVPDANQSNQGGVVRRLIVSSKQGVAAALLAVIGLSAIPAQATPPRYRLTVIQPLDGDLETQGAAINNRGEVAVGGSGPESERVYSWKAGVTTRFDENAGRAPVDINDDAWILSWTSGINYTLSKKGQSTIKLTDDGLYFDSLVPTAINKAKTVVGNGWTYDYDYPAFLRKKDGPVSLFPCCGNVIEANDINNRGCVAATLGIEKDEFGEQWAITHAAFIDKDGSFTDIHPPGAEWSKATAVNDAGDVVGSAVFRGFRYSAGVNTPLGSLIPLGINTAGTIVGYNESGAAVHIDGTTYDLNRLTNNRGKFQLQEAKGINDRGWIVGTGQYWGGRGDYPRHTLRAFVLKPIPKATKEAAAD
jgi:hypothetical protein